MFSGCLLVTPKKTTASISMSLSVHMPCNVMYLSPDRAVPDLLRSGELFNDSEGCCAVLCPSHSSLTLSWLRGLCAFVNVRPVLV